MRTHPRIAFSVLVLAALSLSCAASAPAARGPAEPASAPAPALPPPPVLEKTPAAPAPTPPPEPAPPAARSETASVTRDPGTDAAKAKAQEEPVLNEEIQRLLQLMRTTTATWEARTAAANLLGGKGADAAAACPGLVEMLAEENDNFTYAIYRALRRIGEASIPALANGIRTGKSPGHRFRSARALIAFHGPAVPAILELIKDPDPTTRYMATEAIGRISPPSKEALPVLLDRLEDPHFETARAAARGLVPLRPFSVPGLEEKLKDPDAQVRTLAEMALRMIREKDKTPSRAGPAAPETGTGPAETPGKPASSAVEAPAEAEPFVDVSAARGLVFQHQRGAGGQKYMPETVGAGAAWLDYDGDGYLDLYLVQGRRDLLTALEGTAPADEPGDVLLRNVGGKRFEDVTAKARLGDRGYGMGAAVGDFDNDGWPDLYVTNFGPNVLYHNEQNGAFREVTAEAGVAGGGWSTSAAWGDLDEDGDLDLYVARYVVYDPKTAQPCSTRVKDRQGKTVRIYCYPQHFPGAPDLLFQNQGGGKFTEAGAGGPIGRSGGLQDGKSLGVLLTDCDDDGDLDVLVANDTTANNLWRNLGGLRFEDVGLAVGFALPESGTARAGMGIDRGDADSDRRLDYLVTNFTREPNTLFLNRPAFFEDGTRASGMAEASYLPLGFGVRFIDHDLDGDLDLYVANGHVLDNAAEVEGPGSAGFEQQDSLYQNDGAGRFREISASSGAWFRQKHVGRGVAEADYDNDGDGDLLVTANGGPAVLLENRSGDGKRWVGIDLRIGSARRPVAGARVEVEAGPVRWVREYGADGGYLASHDPRLRVGLGAAEGPVTARVRWPGTREFETTGPLEPGRYHVLRREAPGGR